MNVADLLLLAGLCWMVFRGCRIGLVRSLIALISFVLAYGLALAYGGPASEWIAGENAGHGASMLGFFGVFMATLIVCYHVGRILHSVLEATPLGMLNTLGGGALGLARGLLILGLLVILLRAYPPHASVKMHIDNAVLARPVKQASLVLMDAVKGGIPQAARLYQYLLPESPETSIHPVVDDMTRKAGKAGAKLKGLIKEAHEREKEEQKAPQPSGPSGN